MNQQMLKRYHTSSVFGILLLGTLYWFYISSSVFITSLLATPSFSSFTQSFREDNIFIVIHTFTFFVRILLATIFVFIRKKFYGEANIIDVLIICTLPALALFFTALLSYSKITVILYATQLFIVNSLILLIGGFIGSFFS
jgi:hypothetical protein